MIEILLLKNSCIFMENDKTQSLILEYTDYLHPLLNYKATFFQNSI